jgi:hypothetical protein
MFTKIFFPALFSLIILLPAIGQEQDLTGVNTVPKSYGMFQDEDILDVILRFDMTTYLRKKPKDDFLKAEMTIVRGQTDTLKRDIRLKTRGEFRNRYCSLAPIELNFRKVKFGYSDLDSIRKMKLVNQCSWGSSSESYILREYLVYKMFSVLTDSSYRVRLLQITMIDSEKDRKPTVQYGFFIEPDEMLAKRMNAVELRTTMLTQKHIFPEVMDRISIFNYMIGNYDWSVPGPHNIRVFKTFTATGEQLGIAIPYDFDWTGVVNASYALPAENVGTESVRERLFLGICRSENIFRTRLNDFARHKDDFYKIVNDFPYLKPREKADVTKYLDQFFDQLAGNRNNIISTFRNSCKNF